MKTSDNTDQLFKAWNAFQSEIQNPDKTKTADMGSYKSDYVPIDEMLDHYRPRWTKHGLSMFQSIGGEPGVVTCVTVFMHISGQWMESDMLKEEYDRKNVQKGGSAETYTRRRSLQAALGIAGKSEDDDGKAASVEQVIKETFPGAEMDTETREIVDKITQKQFGMIEAISKEIGLSDEEKIQIFDDLDISPPLKGVSKSNASKIIKKLQDKEKARYLERQAKITQQFKLMGYSRADMKKTLRDHGLEKLTDAEDLKTLNAIKQELDTLEADMAQAEMELSNEG